MTPRQCELLIRRAEERDVPAIQRVARDAWDKTYAGLLGDFDRRELRGHMYSERALLEDVGRHCSEFLVATVDEAVVGFAELVCEGSAGEIARVAVRPAWQRQGLASRLLDEGLALFARHGIREVTAGVECEDEAARSFFEAHGFRAALHGVPDPADQQLPELELIELRREVPETASGGSGATRRNGGRLPDLLEVWCDDGGRFCPRCQRRYRAGVRVCEDCGISLIAERSARAADEDHRFVRVLCTDDASRIGLVTSALEGSDIAFSVREPGGSANGAAEIWVAPSRVDEARDVIDRLEEVPAPVGEE